MAIAVPVASRGTPLFVSGLLGGSLSRQQQSSDSERNTQLHNIYVDYTASFVLVDLFT